MAESQSFDANVPAMPDSNWLFYSRAGQEQPKGSSANKIMDTAVGKSLETGTKLADSLVEDHVRDTVFDVEQRNRMQFINAAQQTATDKGVDHSRDILGADVSGSTLANAPPQVKSAIARVQTVQAATDANKVDKYGYFQRVIPDLQAVRQQYPGYRHVVDAALGNNANAEMNTLIQEINRKDSESREDSRRQQTEVMRMATEGMLGINGASVVNAFNKGGLPFSTVLKVAAPFMARKAEATSAQQNSEIYKWNQTQTGDAMEQEAVKQLRSNAAGGMIFPAVAAGHAEPLPDEDIAKLRSRNVKPEENMAINQRLQAHVIDVENQGWKWASTPWADGRTPLQVLGKEKIQGLINAQSEPLKAWINFSGDPKNFALGDNLKNLQRIATEQSVTNLLNNPDQKVAQTARSSLAVKSIVGEQGVVPLLASLPGGLQGFMKTITSTDLIHAVAGLPDPSNNNDPPSMGKQIEDLKNAGINDPLTYKGHIQMAQLIIDPNQNDTIKRNIARFAFQDTKENRDFIDSFSSGHYENGRWHDGAEEILRDLTDPRIVKQVAKFGDAKISSDYVNTVDSWFRKLAQRNIAQLNDALVATPPSQTVNRVTGQRGSGTPPKIELTWNSDRNVPDLSPETKRALSVTNTRGIMNSYSRQILDSVTRLQRYTGNMAHILETMHEAGYDTDIRTYMLKLLQDTGLNIKDLSASQKLEQAIKATAPKPKDQLGNL